jgi:chemotaxis protein methyltransferase CheR
VARQAGAPSVADFLAGLQRRPDPVAHRSIVDALTTNETSWFRDREPFSALTDVVLPDLVNSRSAARSLRIWSAACSSGQEPYSLAMTLQQALPAGWRYQITGTDISTEMIKRASAGEFSQVEVNRGLPVQLLVHHFARSGTGWKVTPALRENITFQQMNLTAPLPTMAPFDVIFLRNVLIYFDVETKREVLRNVSRMLRPDGWLFLGAAETTIGVDESFERVAIGRTSAYRPRATVPAGTLGKG